MGNYLDKQNSGFMDKRSANFVPMTPISFLTRIRSIYGDRKAVIYGNREYSWNDVYKRCVKIASSINETGINPGEVVSVLASNTPEMFEMHFGIPMSGAVLNTINTRLDPDTIAYILDHAESKLLITDTAFSETVIKALQKTKNKKIKIVEIIDDQDEESKNGTRISKIDYESFLQNGDENYQWKMPSDEWDAMCISYTSGTTGKPKGVIYHHRGAYLMAMGTIPAWNMQMHPTYLYIVPLFHCNGWGHAWMMAILAGTTICCRKITAENIYSLIDKHKVTHFGGAPIILSLLINAPNEVKKPPTSPVQVMTAGAPPPATILEKMSLLGFEITQAYGLTETYGHVAHCAWNEKWNDYDFSRKSMIKARQGVKFPHTEELNVLDQKTGQIVPSDGETIGEIVFRSNCIMKGYHKNPDATEEALGKGYFKTGDLAVCHDNGYVEIKDRLKDIIISGGENISSVEIEAVLYKYPGVAFAAVVAKPDEKWGETPCAFVEMKVDEKASEKDIINFCREHLAGFKCPKQIIFTEIPKTSTGKIQKFMLREKIIN